MSNLVYLDIAGNFISIELLHSLRQCLENNKKLKYLFVSDLHKWNWQAVSKVAESVGQSKLKVLGVGKCTKECVKVFRDLAPKVKIEIEAYVKSTTAHKVLVPLCLVEEPIVKTETLKKKQESETFSGDSTDSYCRELQQAEENKSTNIIV